MKVKVVELPAEYKCCYLIPFSDLHIGDPNFDEQKFMRYVDWVKSVEETRVILVGDIMNTATKESVSDTYSEEFNPNQQLKYAVKLLEPIREKIIGVTSGNHERRIMKSTSIDTSELLAQQLGCYYRKDGLLLKIRLGKQKANGKKVAYITYATHGFGGGKKPGGKINNLKSLAEILLADIYIMGHVHFMTTFQDIFFLPDPRNNTVQEMKRTFVSSSSFVKWGGYSEQFGFSPSKLGTPRLRLAGDRKDVHVSI